jgi:hypothetical protein
MPVLALYFAIAGSFAFTLLLVQTARALVHNVAQAVGAGGIAVSALFLISLAAIDTAFVVLLMRALQLSLHGPAITG